MSMQDDTHGGTDPERERIKAAFIEQRGYWRPWTETMLAVCPGFVEQYANYAGYPARTGPLTPRMVELIYVGLDASASHLFESGLTTHMRRALEVGATQADLFDVLHLVAVQGIASVGQAAEILAELAGAGAGGGLDPQLQARIAAVGAAHALPLQALARLDPGYADAVAAFVEQGPPEGGLTPAERSLVQLALHACFTAYNPGAVRTLVTTALSQGLKASELLQAIQMGAHLAVHGSALGASVFGQIADAGPVSRP